MWRHTACCVDIVVTRWRRRCRIWVGIRVRPWVGRSRSIAVISVSSITPVSSIIPIAVRCRWFWFRDTDEWDAVLIEFVFRISVPIVLFACFVRAFHWLASAVNATDLPLEYRTVTASCRRDAFELFARTIRAITSPFAIRTADSGPYLSV